jgi:hypothetical protein
MTIPSQLSVLEQSSRTVRLERLPTNTTTAAHPVHRWFNFIAGFSPEFVQACLAMTEKRPEDTVLLDPFSGCGTAPLAARLYGASGVGYEAHPFFARISEAKADSPRFIGDLDAVHSTIARGILSRRSATLSISAQTFLHKLFEPDDLASLLGAREQLKEAGLAENPLAFLVLSRMLDYCCLAATDGIYKAPTTTKKAVRPSVALERVLATLQEDLPAANARGGRITIKHQSSEVMTDVLEGSVDLVVTSPPYLNNFDYAEMTRMYLYFWGMADSWGDISTKVRTRLVVNTTTALKGHKQLQQSYRASLPMHIAKEADEVVAALRGKRAEKKGKKEYDFLVFPYLSQMKSVLVESHRTLRRGGQFHMMVSDAALYGVHIPAPQWLAEIMRCVGFTDVQCEMVRPRGHRWVLDKREGSATGLGEYYVHARAS